MSDEKKVVAIGGARSVTKGRAIGGSIGKLPIGIIAAMINGAILFVDVNGEDHELTEEEAGEISMAFNRARWAAQERKQKLVGFWNIRVTSVGYREGRATILRSVAVTFRGVTLPMRLSNLRPTRWAPQGRVCTNCKEPALALYIARDTHDSGGSRIHHAEVCAPCVEALSASAIPKGVLREIT